MSEVSLDIKGKIIDIKDPQEFQSGFKKQVVAVQTQGQYPQKYGLEFIKDKGLGLVETLSVGMEVDIACNLRGNEHNGNYYTSLNAWKINSKSESEEDDLPF